MQNFAFYETVQRLATIKGVTIKQMEKDLGLAPSHANKWKKSLPSFKYLLMLADYFGVSVDYLTGREEYRSEKETELLAMFRKMSEAHQTDLLRIAELYADMDKPISKESEIL